MLEIFVFVQMGGDLKKINCVAIHDAETDAVAQTLASFKAVDAGAAGCSDPRHKQQILGIIESAFGSFVDFNASDRQIFAKRDGTQKLDGGRTASPELRPEDLDNSYDLVSQAV